MWSKILLLDLRITRLTSVLVVVVRLWSWTNTNGTAYRFDFIMFALFLCLKTSLAASVYIINCVICCLGVLVASVFQRLLFRVDTDSSVSLCFGRVIRQIAILVLSFWSWCWTPSFHASLSFDKLLTASREFVLNSCFSIAKTRAQREVRLRYLGVTSIVEVRMV